MPTRGARVGIGVAGSRLVRFAIARSSKGTFILAVPLIAAGITDVVIPRCRALWTRYAVGMQVEGIAAAGGTGVGGVESAGSEKRCGLFCYFLWVKQLLAGQLPNRAVFVFILYPSAAIGDNGGGIPSQIELAIFAGIQIFGKPDQPVANLLDMFRYHSGGAVGNGSNVVLWAKYLAHQHGYLVQVVRSDLHYHAPVVGQQLPGQGQLLVQSVQVGMDAVAIGVAESLDAQGVLGDAVQVLRRFQGVDGGLEVAAEADVVGRIQIDQVDLAAQILLFQEGGHGPLGGSPDQPVAPVAVLIAVGMEFGVHGGAAVGIGKAVEGGKAQFALAAAGFLEQGLDELFRVDFVVDIEGAGLAYPVDQVGALPVQDGIPLYFGFLPQVQGFFRQGVLDGRVGRRFGRGQIDPGGAGILVTVRNGLGAIGGGHGATPGCRRRPAGFDVPPDGGR